jgi:hypothetical protein
MAWNPFGNPADAGMGYLNQIPGMLHQINDPYIQRGNEQYAGLNKAYTGMAQDPTGFLNQMMAAYQPSKGFQIQKDEALRAAGNSAAAGGMRGSFADQEGQARLADTLMGQDMQQWLQNVLGIQGYGLQGQQNFYNQGYGASQNMASDLSNVLGSQATLGYQGQNAQNQGILGILGSLVGAGGAAAGGYLGRK